MTFFDINTIEKSFKNTFLFGINKRGLVSYFRKDYHGDQNLSLDEAVRKTIKTSVTVYKRSFSIKEKRFKPM